jgi:hypothetical protein
VQPTSATSRELNRASSEEFGDLTLRKNHARVRHWVWLAASIEFLIPLSVLIALGSHIHWRTAPQIAQSTRGGLISKGTKRFTSITTTSISMTRTLVRCSLRFTPYGWKVARLFSRLDARVFRPAIAMFTADDAVLPFPLRSALDHVDAQLDELIYQTFPAKKAS